MRRTQTTITITVKQYNRLEKLRQTKPNSYAKERFDQTLKRILDHYETTQKETTK